MSQSTKYTAGPCPCGNRAPHVKLYDESGSPVSEGIFYVDAAQEDFERLGIGSEDAEEIKAAMRTYGLPDTEAELMGSVDFVVSQFEGQPAFVYESALQDLVSEGQLTAEVAEQARVRLSEASGSSGSRGGFLDLGALLAQLGGGDDGEGDLELFRL